MHKTFQMLNVAFVAAFTAVIMTSITETNAQSSPKSERELIAVLRSDAAEADKALACKHLALYGSSESVSELAKRAQQHARGIGLA